MSKKKKPICSVENCEKLHTAKGYCQTHYVRLKRKGLLGDPAIQIKGRTVCDIPSCGNAHVAKGMCGYHYRISYYHKLSMEQISLLPLNCFFCNSTKDLVIDHDHACCPPKQQHTCGKCIRMVLCRKCNSGIGFLGDDARLYKVIAEYLESSNKDSRLF
jgi:hypothetical protein